MGIQLGVAISTNVSSIPDDTFVDIAIPLGIELRLLETLMKMNTHYNLGVQSETINISVSENPDFIGYEVSKIRSDLAIPLRISHVATDRMQSEIKANPENQV